MKFYNTLSRKIENFKPQHSPKVSVYTCGPTVYDYPHIGNWFTFIRYDLLIRALKASNFEPHWVMNITDVGHLTSDADEGEDKLEKGAKREGKNAWQIAEQYTDYFIKALNRLNISKPNELPRATEHIQEQIDFIKDLEAKGYTYLTSDGVYFDTSKFKKYGELAKLDIKNLRAGARVKLNAEKRNPTDFALWKLSPTGQKRDMEWPSPWGKGFPGWHIECSAMCLKYLGPTVDIHAGGIDHIPIHHTNEIAQSQALTGKPLAKYWLHSNHILLSGEKIAKSVGNGITLEDVEYKGYSLEALRLLVLESHYRSQAEFSWETLEAAQNRLKSIQAFADLQHQAEDYRTLGNDYFDKLKHDLTSALQDDLNTPEFLKQLSESIDYIHTHTVGISIVNIKAFKSFLKFLDDITGLDLAHRPDITKDQKDLIKRREKARHYKDWAQSDEIRDQLEKDGIGLNDAASGTIWFRR